MQNFKSFAILIIFLSANTLLAQNVQQQAKEKGEKAVTLEDQGKFDDAIKLLNEAQVLDPSSLVYPYELAYSYYSLKDYNKAISYLSPLMHHKDVIDRVFQLLGNSYDDLGQSDKALQTYDEGLKVFPLSGKLYLEKGNVYWQQKKYGSALPLYEQGIKADPAFSSNYYRAAKLYFSSTEQLWGMIYGEIFINLEPNTERTKEISKLLYDTYKSQIQFKDKNSTTVSFSKMSTINATQVNKERQFKLPYAMIYEPSLAYSVAAETNIDLNSLDRIRTRFIDFYYEKNFNKTYPNALFDYQKSIKDAGCLEAYNHWLLLMGDELAFNVWQAANQSKWQNFIKWFSANRLKLDVDHRFYSQQYL